MKYHETRVIVEMRQADGTWRRTAFVPLDHEQREILCGWILFAPPPEPDQAEPPDNSLSSAEDLWGLPDNALRDLLGSEQGELVGLQLQNFMPDFNEAIIQRFGSAALSEFYARRIGTFGMDADAFRALSLQEQNEFLMRFDQSETADQ